jgi:hypothetical protein
MACSRNTWLGLLAFAAAGCGGPPSAKLDVPFWPVAVGSYAEVKVYDASYVWTPSNPTITSTSLSDPSVARVLSQTETPAVGDCVLALGAAGAASYPTTLHIPIRLPSQ